MQQRILQHLDQLLRCDTQNPPRQIDPNHEIFSYINSVLQLAGGFSVDLVDHGDGRVTYFATRGQPCLLFNVHLDTVQVGDSWNKAALRLTIDGDRAFGRGACDIKGAAAVLLAIAEQTEVSMAVVFSTDEEGSNGCCIKSFSESLATNSYEMIVVAEPTQCQALLTHRGYLSVLGDFTGLAGHSSDARALTDNAIHRASRWASAAIDYAFRERQQGRDICFNIGTMYGRSASNVIADKTRVHWSARVPPGIDNEVTLGTVCKLTEASCQVQWNVRFRGPTLPATGADDQIARRFCTQHDLALGPPAEFWTEAALFSSADHPVIVLGPGNIEQAHSADEWVSLDQLSLAGNIYERLLRESQ